MSYFSKLVANENILVELFAEDYGDCSPNLANIYQLQQVSQTCHLLK